MAPAPAAPVPKPAAEPAAALAVRADVNATLPRAAPTQPVTAAPTASAPAAPAPPAAATAKPAAAPAAANANSAAPKSMPASWYAMKAAAATTAAAAVASAATAGSASANAPASPPSSYAARASSLPPSDATRGAKPAAAAVAQPAAQPVALPVESVLLSTARKGTVVLGGELSGNAAIDLERPVVPRPQTPSLWSNNIPRRPLTDDEILLAEVMPSPGLQSIKAERVPIRAEPLLVRPDVSKTISPAVTAKPAASAASAPATRTAADYSELKPIPVDVPLVSTASGTAGGHAISQARMGVEPAKPAAPVKPNVSATLPPGALGED
ncbi:MAG: hypothetical protein HOP09_17455 [Hyphomicrobium sp.]|nr:hypothetical protein [Hyphomicrobium sp.]